MSGSDSENEIGVPTRRKCNLQLPINGQNPTQDLIADCEDSKDDDEDFNLLFKRKKKLKPFTSHKLKASPSNTVSSASSDDEDNGVLNSPVRSVRKKRVNSAVTRAAPMEADTEDNLQELFQNKDLFQGDSEESSEGGENNYDAKEPGSHISQVAKGDTPKSKGKGGKKERKQLHSETQKLVRESSIQLPAYQPKKKSLSDFLSKLNSSKPQPRPKEAVVAEQPALVPSQPMLVVLGGDRGESLVVGRFQDRFNSQLKTVAAEQPTKEDKNNSSGLSWQKLKATLKDSLGKQRATETAQLEQMKRFEEDETLGWEEEEEEEELTTDSESESERPVCEEGDVGCFPDGSVQDGPDTRQSSGACEGEGEEGMETTTGGEAAGIHHQGDGETISTPYEEDSKDREDNLTHKNGFIEKDDMVSLGDFEREEYAISKKDPVENDDITSQRDSEEEEDDISKEDSEGEDAMKGVKRARKSCTIASDDEGDDPGEVDSTANCQQRRLNFEGITTSIVKVDSGFETAPATIQASAPVPTLDTAPVATQDSVSRSASQATSPVKSLNSLSQDLFSDSTQSSSVVVRQHCRSQPLPTLADDESITQFLDTQGFMRMRMSKKPSHEMPAGLASLLGPPPQPGGGGANMQTLLGLCSGQFTGGGVVRPSATPSVEEEGGASGGLLRPERLDTDLSTQAVRELLGWGQTSTTTTATTKSVSLSGLFRGASEDSTLSPDAEVLALCSGKFPSGGLPSQLLGKSPSQASGSGHLFTPSLGKSPSLPSTEVLDSSDDDDDMPVVRRTVAAPAKPSKEERLAGFVEAEAELSGSDVGPEEEDDDDARSELDRYEADGGGSDVPESDSELQQQVNKAHMRGVLADDKLQLKEMKERFLAEGDLHENGMYLRNGLFRKRRLATDSSQLSLELFSEEPSLDSGGEDVEEDSDDAAEVSRRRKRLERHRYLKIMRTSRGSLLEEDEDSQTVLGMLSTGGVGPPANSATPHCQGAGPGRSTPQPLCGSFMRRNRTQLKRLASATSRTPVAAGGEGQKGVFFKIETPTDDAKATKKPESASKVAQQPAKKARLLSQADHFSEDSNSVFDLLTCSNNTM